MAKRSAPNRRTSAAAELSNTLIEATKSESVSSAVTPGSIVDAICEALAEKVQRFATAFAAPFSSEVTANFVDAIHTYRTTPIITVNLAWYCEQFRESCGGQKPPREWSRDEALRQVTLTLHHAVSLIFRVGNRYDFDTVPIRVAASEMLQLLETCPHLSELHELHPAMREMWPEIIPRLARHLEPVERGRVFEIAAAADDVISSILVAFFDSGESLKSDKGPWMDTREMMELMKLNHEKSLSADTIGRRKDAWGAEKEVGTNRFRFNKSKLRGLGIKYPDAWDSEPVV